MTPKAKSYFHRGGETPLIGSTIPEHLLSIVSRFPDQEAIVSLPQKNKIEVSGFFHSN